MGLVHEVWRNNSQWFEITIDKLINYRVLDPTSVLAYCLSSQTMKKDYTRLYLYSVLRATLVKIIWRMNTTKLRLAEMRKSIQDKNTKRANDTVDDSNGMDVDDAETMELNKRQSAFDVASRDYKQGFLLMFQV